MTTTAELIERYALRHRKNGAPFVGLAEAGPFVRYEDHVARLAEQEAVIAEMDAEIARWQNNWDANVQEMSEKFRAVNIARVIEATGADIFDLSEKAQRLESELSRVSARLAEATEAFAYINARLSTNNRTFDELIADTGLACDRARAFLNPDTEVTK